jgi:hypothetical protein
MSRRVQKGLVPWYGGSVSRWDLTRPRSPQADSKTFICRLSACVRDARRVASAGPPGWAAFHLGTRYLHRRRKWSCGPPSDPARRIYRTSPSRLRFTTGSSEQQSPHAHRRSYAAVERSPGGIRQPNASTPSWERLTVVRRVLRILGVKRLTPVVWAAHDLADRLVTLAHCAGRLSIIHSPPKPGLP